MAAVLTRQLHTILYPFQYPPPDGYRSVSTGLVIQRDAQQQPSILFDFLSSEFTSEASI